jgi:hypothetical protein
LTGNFQEMRGRIVVWLEKTTHSEPHSVVSTLAHELGHVQLLADGRCDPKESRGIQTPKKSPVRAADLRIQSLSLEAV